MMWFRNKRAEALEVQNAQLVASVKQLQASNAALLSRYEQVASAYEDVAKRVAQTLTPEFFMNVFQDIGETLEEKNLESYSPSLEYGLYGGEVKES
jgi:hypothetical protein